MGEAAACAHRHVEYWRDSGITSTVEGWKCSDCGIDFAPSNELARLREALAQVDDILVTDWISVKDNNYRQALHDLITFNIQIDNDPAVSKPAAERRLLMLNAALLLLKYWNQFRLEAGATMSLTIAQALGYSGTSELHGPWLDAEQRRLVEALTREKGATSAS